MLLSPQSPEVIAAAMAMHDADIPHYQGNGQFRSSAAQTYWIRLALIALEAAGAKKEHEPNG